MIYPELITVCNIIHTFMVRDAAEFLANFGVIANITATFETKFNEFEEYPFSTLDKRGGKLTAP